MDQDMKVDHERQVERQFGAQAAAYVASTVHAAGADLERMAGAVRDRPPGRVLDIGCGGGHVAFTLAPFAEHVVAADLSGDMLAAVAAEAARRGLANIETSLASAGRLPFPDGSFDVVASRFSAHHWDDLSAGLREARRVARPGALALFADAVSPGEPLLDTALQAVEILRDPSHVRNYSTAEWGDALSDAGFAVTRLMTGRLRLDFASWIARIATPAIHAEAIRSLQGVLSGSVRDHFAFEGDGSFTLDTALVEAVAR
jgi:ubiquinone/menaquinone biosynthesis C-methylase UbiE